MKKLVINTLFTIQVSIVFAQSTTGILGKVVDAKSHKPLQNVVTTIQNTNLTELTDENGKFLFKDIIIGSQLLQIKTQGFRDQLFYIEITEDKMLDLGVIVLEEDQTEEQQLSLITLTENDLGDDNSGSESTSGLLQATRDAYQQAAAFNWGQARFRIRGLDNEYGKTMINGISMDKVYDGRPQYSNWGGLNDATRNQEFTMGSAPSDYTFGNALGTQEINTRASIYRPGTRISMAGTNTNYSWRTMVTHASGTNSNGWAFVVSGSRRWAKEGYFEGTDYAANALFVSIEKKINDKQSLNLTSIYAHNRRGKNSPNSEEINDLAGIKYNSYWGYQNGVKRNSREKDVEEPMFILSHYWKITNKTTLNTNVAYQLGSIGNSRLDYNFTRSPDPIYYRKLPSYFSTYHDNTGQYLGNTPDYVRFADEAKTQFLQNKQMDWEGLYYGNTKPIIQNNIEVGREAAESLAILYEDRTDDKQWTANTLLNSQIADNITLNAGATYRKLRSENYQKVLDLLGGSSYYDIDPFLSNKGNGREQSDLDNPDRRVVTGDKFGYRYLLHANIVDAFTQFKFTYNKFDFYLAQSFSRTQYQREGLYKNGNYANTSKGESAKAVFENFGFKAGVTYKITGQNYLDFNGVYMTKAPSMRNTFPNVRLNNNRVADLKSEAILSADASYLLRTPKWKARITGYYSRISNSTDIAFYFAEGIGVLDENTNELVSGNGNAFVAEIVTGLIKKNLGGELGIEYQLTSTIKGTASISYGQYTYDSNPNVKLNADTNRSVIDYGSATLKNYKQPGMPQQAYAVGLEYRDPKFWWIGVNANYLADNYIDISPLLRTNNFFKKANDPDGFPFLGATEAAGRKLLKQEKFNPITLINLVGGKSWRTSYKNRNTIGFFVSINNVLDKTYKTGGFEQARNANFEQLSQDMEGPARSFGPKYFYGYGRTCFLNLYYNF